MPANDFNLSTIILLTGALTLTAAPVTYAEETTAHSTLEAVIGPDTRSPINTPYAPPYNAITRITSDGQFFCTGFLISEDMLVTAGHCIQNWKTDSTTQQLTRRDVKLEQLKVYPGFDGNTNAPLLGSCTVTGADTLPAWRERGDKNADMGIMILNCSKPNLTNHLRYAAPTDQLLNTKPAVTLSGYQGDKADDYHQWESTGIIQAATPQLLAYDNDAFAGSSGSPVWVWENGVPVVIGIHTYEYTPTNQTTINIGTRLTPEIVKALDAIK